MTDLRFMGDWRVWGGLVAGLTLAVAAWLLYWRETRARAGAVRWLLPSLRALAALLLVMMLTGPVLHHRKTIGEIARILLFVDASASMGIADREMELPRKLFIAQQLGWLGTNKFDANLRAAAAALANAQETASRTKANLPAPQFHEFVRVFATNTASAAEFLGKVGPATWPQISGQVGRLNTELTLPSRKLADTAVGHDPNVTERELAKLAAVAARFEAEARTAFTNHVLAVAEKREADVLAAIQKFDTQTRWQRLEAALFGNSEGVAKKLAELHNLEVLALADHHVEPVWLPGERKRGDPPKPPPAFTLLATNLNTDLSEPVKTRALSLREGERTAVILLSDGQHNSGGPPAELARLLGARGVPVFPVGIGMQQPPPDLAVLTVKGPDTVAADGRVRGTVELKDDMPPGTAFILRVAQGERLMWEKELTTENKHLRTVEFDFPVKELVADELKLQDKDLRFASLPLHFIASVTALPGEKDKANNSGALWVNATTQRPKLLLLDGRPRWEYRYLRNLFERDDRWEVNALLAGAGGEQKNWARGKGPGQFPGDRETLFTYQLVIFGDLPANQLRPQEMEWLRDFVGQRGGGVIFIDGRQERLASLQQSPLAPLFPVSFEGRPLDGVPMIFRLAASGSSLTPLTLVADPLENERVWSFMPAPHWLAPARALPGAETWLQAVVGESRSAAAVYRRYGAGKTLYLAFDESWRWRFKVGDLHHQKFWNQTAKFVMESPFAVQDRFVSLDSGALNYDPGATAEIRTRILDAQGQAMSRARAEAWLMRDGRKVATVALAPDANETGIYRGRTAPLTDGDYEVRVRVDGLPETEMKARTGFAVRRSATGELAELNCNEPLLRELASISGGRYYREEELGALVERLKPLSQGRVVESETVLWQSWWWFGAVMLLLALEWALRKRAGML
ncbi:MAG: VWA domain-containing protein [Proteobacteria bacterium]|nr:VWA domain-containing protein [Pseudomonadota bacterium]